MVHHIAWGCSLFWFQLIGGTAFNRGLISLPRLAGSLEQVNGGEIKRDKR